MMKRYNYADTRSIQNSNTYRTRNKITRAYYNRNTEIPEHRKGIDSCQRKYVSQIQKRHIRKISESQWKL